MKAKSKTTKVIEIYGDKRLRVTLPADARLTFGPWSPPKPQQDYSDRQAKLAGTLRAYRGAGTANILAVFTNVMWFHVAEVSVEDLSPVSGAAFESIAKTIRDSASRPKPKGKYRVTVRDAENVKTGSSIFDEIAAAAEAQVEQIITKAGEASDEAPMRIVAETLKEEATVRRRRDNGT